MSERMQEKEKDPVCQMSIDKQTAAAEAEYEGKTYYFCSRQCREQFEANPQKYVRQKQAHSQCKGGHGMSGKASAIVASTLLMLAVAAAAQPVATRPSGRGMHNPEMMRGGQAMPMQRMMQQHRQTLQSIDQTLEKIEQAQQSGDQEQIRQALLSAQDQLRQVRQQMSQRMQMMQQMHEPVGGQGTGGQQQYTCPMHPEVHSDKPGTCPKCKMTLEPAVPSDADESGNHAAHHGGDDDTDR